MTDLARIIEIASTMPPYPIMERERLQSEGYQIHNPSLMPCLISSADWQPDSFVAVKEREAVISLVMAWRPRTGAWRRLVNHLSAQGYGITVIEPLFSMEKVLIATGFHGPKSIGSTFEDRMTVWIKACP